MSKFGRCAAGVLMLLVLITGASTSYGQITDDAKVYDDALNYIGQLSRQGKYAEATTIAEKLLKFADRAYGGEHDKTLVAAETLATLYTARSRYAEAENMLLRILKIRERNKGPDTIEVAQTANNLAELYKAQGRFTDAEPYYKRAIAITEKVQGPAHPSLGNTLDNLGALYFAQGRYADAEPLMKRALAILDKAVGPVHADVSTSLNNLASLYKSQGRLAEAEPLYKRALSIDEKLLGPNHPEVAISLNNLAALYRIQERYTKAEQLYRRALAIVEKTLGRHHPNYAVFLGNLAALYTAQGRYADAEEFVKRALVIWEKAAPNHPNVGSLLRKLAGLYQSQSKYAEAEPVFKRALVLQEKVLGPNHVEIARTSDGLALLYTKLGRYDEAEQLYKRALSITEKALPPGHNEIGRSINNLAELYRTEGRYAEAEQLYQRSLGMAEKALGADHSDVAAVLNNLALLYQAQGRFADAEAFFKRSLAIREKALGPNHRDVAVSLDNLAVLYLVQKRLNDAVTFQVRALSIWKKVAGLNHPDVATSLNNLAGLYAAAGEFTKAEQTVRHSLSIIETKFGPNHIFVASSLSNLADMYRLQGRFADAAPINERVLAIRKKVLPPEHPDIATTFNNIGGMYFDQSDWVRATDYWRKGTSVIIRRAMRDTDELGQKPVGRGTNEADKKQLRFISFLKAAYRFDTSKNPSRTAIAREMFEIAQWASNSEAARSLGQMAARGAKNNPQLAALVRERQDLVAEWRARDGIRTTALALAAEKRNQTAEIANAARLDAIDARLTTIDERLKRDFGDYSALASPAPSSIDEVQALLGADEALVLFLDTPQWKPTPEETFIWLVTKTDFRWVRSDLGTAALTREVQALRCGLDRAAWSKGPHCGKLLNADFTAADADAGKPLPFDHARAHALYKALFGQVYDIIKGKHLLIVPSGPLTQLPFQVLVTAPPVSTENKSAAWLVRDHAVTILPAVSSLKALRRTSQPSGATKPLIGFGNPLLDGPQNDPQYGAYYKKRAKLARDNQQCRTKFQRLAALFGLRGVTPVETRGRLAQVSHIRMQAPLPETAGELCDVAHDLKADPTEMRLGARATEREVKRLSASGQLAHYRIVHFATHGTLAGELKGANEPGLLLTPPNKASRDDDGYLSASEIAQLKLDADWVILSACNTAAGDAKGAQALSGLARAFIYAQARALLVSHWAVNSDATVKLITGAMREMARDAKVGHAEALRRSMLALIDKGDAREAHPANWAPFIVVGEGSAR